MQIDEKSHGIAGADEFAGQDCFRQTDALMVCGKHGRMNVAVAFGVIAQKVDIDGLAIFADLQGYACAAPEVSAALPEKCGAEKLQHPLDTPVVRALKHPTGFQTAR